MEQTKNLVETITKGIQEKKGSNINIIDLSGIEGHNLSLFYNMSGQFAFAGRGDNRLC